MVYSVCRIPAIYNLRFERHITFDVQNNKELSKSKTYTVNINEWKSHSLKGYNSYIKYDSKGVISLWKPLRSALYLFESFVKWFLGTKITLISEMSLSFQMCVFVCLFCFVFT